MSSPNFLENSEVNLSSGFYFMEILHKIFILGAILLILINS